MAWHGSLARAAALLRGEPLFINPGSVDLGSAAAGETHEFVIKIENLGSAPVTLVGAKADCNCVVTRGLPAELSGHETRVLNCEAKFVGGPGVFKRHVEFYTTSNVRGFTPLVVTGTLVETASPPTALQE